jgi:hypothetical protein
MEKINLETNTEFSKIAEESPLKPKAKIPAVLKVLFIVFLFIGSVAAFLYFFLVIPAIRLRDNGFSLAAEAQGIYQGIQTQNLAQSVEKIKSTKEKFGQVKSDYQKLIWIKYLPYFSAFYKDGQHLFTAGGYLLETADVAIEGLQPYADMLGLEENKDLKKPEAMTTEDRLMLALDTLDKIQPSLDKIGEKLDLAKKEIDQINPNRYPEEIMKKKVREKIVALIKMVDGTVQMVNEVKPVVSYLKPLLGFPGEKRYLVLFQNDAELRPTGGFLTAYALLSINKGNVKPLGSFDIYSLDNKFGNRVKPPEAILKYHKNVFYWHLRDMNLSPDFKVSMDAFIENYKKVAPANIDGVIAVDTQLLVNILKVLGPIGVADWGNFSAETDKRCNCPQVFYELEKYADKPLGIVNLERKAILGPLMHSILLNIMQSPRKKWPEFFNVAFGSIQEKHLLFYFFDEKIQQAMEAINAAGRIKEYGGDYLHINDCNFAGAKSNMYIKENVEQKIEVSGDGEITKTVTIDYKNPQAASDCNLERGELCLNALYRDWIRVYVPKGSQLIEAKGSEVEVSTYEDLGKTVFEAFYGDKSPLRPLGKAQLVFKYKLPFKAEKGKPYSLLIQKQPGTYGYEYTVNIGGKQDTFELTTDREIKF